MTRRIGRKRRTWKRGTIVRIGVIVALIVVYSGYSIATPSAVQVPKVESSATDTTLLKVTLHNPTFKLVTGQLLSVETEVDIPRQGGGSRVLGSLAQTYPFTLFPQSSTELDVAMNSRVLPEVQYDITLHIDGVGQNITTVTLPKA